MALFDDADADDLLEVIVGTVPVAVDVMAGEGGTVFKAPKSTSIDVGVVVVVVDADDGAAAEEVQELPAPALVELEFAVFDILLPWAVLLTPAGFAVVAVEAAADDAADEVLELVLLMVTFSLIFELVLLLLIFFNLAAAAAVVVATPPLLLSNNKSLEVVVAGVIVSVAEVVVLLEAEAEEF